MASESTGLSIVFKVAKILCALCAFICAMALGAPWHIPSVLFFNVLQLVVLVYAIAVLLLRVTNVLKVNLWKMENIVSMVLGSLELTATSACAVSRASASFIGASPVPKAVVAFINTHVNTGAIAAVNMNVTAMTPMLVFGYMTGIICIFHGIYVVLTN